MLILLHLVRVSARPAFCNLYLLNEHSLVNLHCRSASTSSERLATCVHGQPIRDNPLRLAQHAANDFAARIAVVWKEKLNCVTPKGRVRDGWWQKECSIGKRLRNEHFLCTSCICTGELQQGNTLVHSDPQPKAHTADGISRFCRWAPGGCQVE